MLTSHSICIVTCGDKLVVRWLFDRLFQATVLSQLGARDDNCCLLTVPGASCFFAQNPVETFLPHFEVFYRLKDVRSLIFMDHTPCGRYEDNDPEEHRKNMEAVAAAVKEAFLDVEISMHLLDHERGQLIF